MVWRFPKLAVTLNQTKPGVDFAVAPSRVHGPVPSNLAPRPRHTWKLVGNTEAFFGESMVNMVLNLWFIMVNLGLRWLSLWIIMVW